jgi:hypothetical protein
MVEAYIEKAEDEGLRPQFLEEFQGATKPEGNKILKTQELQHWV